MKTTMFALFLVVALLTLGTAACTQSVASPTAVSAPASGTKAPEPAAAGAALAKAAEPTKAPAVQPTARPPEKMAYPQGGKTVTSIVPFAAGGGFDFIGRLLATNLSKELGGNFEVVNRPGATTQIAATELAGAKPDGYTIGWLSIPTVITTYLDPERKATYSRKDFQSIALVAVEPTTFQVLPDSPYKTLKDFIDAAKTKPGQLKVGTAGLLGLPHLGAVALEKETGAQFAYVHFDGGAPAKTALLGGHIDAASASGSNFVDLSKNGTVRVLGVMGKEQSPFFPGIKTMIEQGYKVDAPTYYSVATPANVSKEIVNVLSTSIKEFTQDQEMATKIGGIGLRFYYGDPDQMNTVWAEMETWTGPVMDLAKGK